MRRVIFPLCLVALIGVVAPVNAGPIRNFFHNLGFGKQTTPATNPSSPMMTVPITPEPALAPTTTPSSTTPNTPSTDKKDTSPSTNETTSLKPNIQIPDTTPTTPNASAGTKPTDPNAPAGTNPNATVNTTPVYPQFMPSYNNTPMQTPATTRKLFGGRFGTRTRGY
jgi:hypothetical protein